MTVLFGWFQRLVRVRRPEQDATQELINEAERTRRELLRITDRLAGHVAQLQAFTRAYTRGRGGVDRG
jgi:N6-adenosine-specific RNA methylase IME4